MQVSVPARSSTQEETEADRARAGKHGSSGNRQLDGRLIWRLVYVYPLALEYARLWVDRREATVDWPRLCRLPSWLPVESAAFSDFRIASLSISRTHTIVFSAKGVPDPKYALARTHRHPHTHSIRILWIHTRGYTP
ncbi:hypothetical protein MSAN_00422100 [Mycena sanguinolenta]|uniref:Uncharacterized protein n=1 Tax=Mycena sanguinolenta TaxID=230812 RepID=A0A8H6ZDL4_9AGAR|nr:hypothetical protein MSAN_00422100 [Mycena sanguinolenta]